ncbi:MAG: PAS domain S-box protein [Bdellovibrionales bacterium]|nr:PAS domain S-box protein [Bdellovibrionales bacterium]
MPTAKKLTKKSHLKVVSPALAASIGTARARPSDRYQVLFEQASDAILTVNADGMIDAVNQAAEDLTGFVREELLKQSIEILIPDPAAHRIPDRARPISLDCFQVSGTFEDIAILRKDGYVRLVELSVRLVEASGKGLAIVLLRDVSEKKRMERELITKHAELRNAYFQLEKKNAELQSMQETLVQAGKMAALGELAAGIAHELNQPLQGIRGYAQELQAILPPSKNTGNAEVQSFLGEITSNVDKMASIIDYLRTFVRKSTEDFEWVDVHGAIDEALKMLARQFQVRGIKVERHYSGHLPKIYANPLQLEQVFINLATNARDAIEASGRGWGKITIGTKVLPNGFVEVDFHDDGVGMNEKTKAKAFNPFFTTKEVGKGMGLGLSLSYGMISKLHGSIVVESEVGKGATFLVRLPKDFRELA